MTFYSRNSGMESGFVSGNDMRISNELYEAYNPQNPIDLRLQYLFLTMMVYSLSKIARRDF